MKGSLLVAMAQYVCAKHNLETWSSVLQGAGLSPNTKFMALETVEDDVYFKLVESTARQLRLMPQQLWEELANYWILEHTDKYMPFYYRNMHSARDFLLQMNEVHEAVGRASSRSATPPEFEFESLTSKEMLVTYKSTRNMIPYFISLIKAVAKKYQEEIVVRQLSDNQVKLIFA